MKIKEFTLLLSTFFVFLFLNIDVFAAKQCGEFLDRIILKFKTVSSLDRPDLERAWWDSFSQKHNLPIQSVKPMASGAYLVSIDSKKLGTLSKSLHLSKDAYVNQVLIKLLKQSDIKYADRDMTHCPILPPATKKASLGFLNIPLISHASQWDQFSFPGVLLESAPGLLDGAWAITLGYANPPIVVSNFEAINYNPDLAPNVLTGWNFHTHSPDTTDPTNDHGTHTAGIMAATGIVSGITGMGPLLKVLPIAEVSLSELEQSIYWSMGIDIPGVPHNNYPVKVANLSFIDDEFTGCPPSLQEAFDAFVENRGVIIAAAGNNNKLVGNHPPQVCNHVMVVAATNLYGERASSSNYGSQVAVAAPGGEQENICDPRGILSTVGVEVEKGCQNSGFSFVSGTSMATPHVAGIAGLIYAVNPSLSSQEVYDILLAGVMPFAATSNPEYSCIGEKSCGAGIVNAYNSVQLALSGRKIIAAPTQSALRLKHALDPFNQCPSNLYVPTVESVASSLPGRWVINKKTRACQPLSAYQKPILQIDKQQLRAIYGTTVLTLKTSELSCQVNYPHGFIC